jgi:hypothetical protein
MPGPILKDMTTTCWEHKKCKNNACPMHGKEETNDCWYTVGTYCGGEVQGEFARKYLTCGECDYFKILLHNHVGQETLILAHIMKTGDTLCKEMFISEFPVEFGIELYKQWKKKVCDKPR